ncbi:MAG: ABC transporter ATP-binding protein [Pseudomonadota bacterium]
MVIVAQQLTKIFRVGLRGQRFEAVRDCSFEVHEGEVFGFVGPNGAGKSTTIHMLLGLVRPTRGQGSVLGHPIGSLASRQRLGYLPELPNFYGYIRAGELLELSGRLAGMGRNELARDIPIILQRVGLADRQHGLLRTFSKGMLQRVGLAQALLGPPRLVILDEPMSGLDPVGRQLVRNVILDLKRNGTTVFFSTHVMPDVEVLCDRVALMAHGHIVRVGKVDDLMRGGLTGSEVLVRLSQAHMTSSGPDGLHSDRVGDVLRITVPQESQLPQVLDWARERGQIVSVIPMRSSLEDVVVRELERDRSAEARS